MLKTSGQMGGRPMRILQAICALIVAEDGVFPHGRAGPRILRSEGLEIGDLSVPRHQDHGAGDAARFNIRTKHLAETGKPVGGHADLLGLRTAQRIGSGGHRRNKKSSRIYSMTKPVVSVAVMMLWEEGRFDIDDPVAKYLPEMKNPKVAVVRKSADGKSNVELEPAARQPTIQQLLDHTGGLSYDILPEEPRLSGPADVS
jgi:Beta-lactamase